MIDFGGGFAIAVALAAVWMAGFRADRLARAYLAQRTLLHAERQRAKREARRTRGLVRLVGKRCATVRVIERDGDGFRMIEVENSALSDRRAA